MQADLPRPHDVRGGQLQRSPTREPGSARSDVRVGRRERMLRRRYRLSGRLGTWLALSFATVHVLRTPRGVATLLGESEHSRSYGNFLTTQLSEVSRSGPQRVVQNFPLPQRAPQTTAGHGGR